MELMLKDNQSAIIFADIGEKIGIELVVNATHDAPMGEHILITCAIATLLQEGDVEMQALVRKQIDRFIEAGKSVIKH